MAGSLVENMVEDAVRNTLDNKVTRLMRGVRKIAAKQGGSSTVENYKLLGKRVLVVFGVVIVVQAVTSAVGSVIARKREDKRIEQVARRVYEEERQKEKSQA